MLPYCFCRFRELGRDDIDTVDVGDDDDDVLFVLVPCLPCAWPVVTRGGTEQ